MGLVLMAVIWLITLVSTYFFVAKTWWLPHGASTAAEFIDGQFALTYVLMGIIFVAAQMALGYLVWKYRDRPAAEPVRYSHGNTMLEVIWTTLDGRPFHRVEPDGQERLGGGTLRPRGTGIGSGRGYGDAVCLVLPLSRAGRQVRSDQSQTDGSFVGK